MDHRVLSSRVLFAFGAILFQFNNALQLNPIANNNAQLYYVPATGTYVWGRRDQPLYNYLSTTTPKFVAQSIFSGEDVQCGVRNIDSQLYRQPKIVGGATPRYGAFPWQVEIAKFDREGTRTWRHHCGGALLPSPNGDFILTAAHCLQPPVNVNELRVSAGDFNLKQHDLHEQIMGVADYILHPSFRKNGPYSNDIAVIRVRPRHGTNHGFTFTTHVHPICLPEQNVGPAPGTWCDVSGWGVQNNEDLESLATELQAITVPIIENSECSSTTFYGGRQQQILDSMICAGLLSGGQDACNGDSGGPLACQINGRFHLAGVVSWGDGCGKPNRPGVYTRVDYFVDWINKSMDILNARRKD